MPSPVKHRIVVQRGDSDQFREVAGYVNSRKDHLGWYKEEDGRWLFVHRATGYVFLMGAERGIKSSYPEMSRVCQRLQETAADIMADIATFGFAFGWTEQRRAVIMQQFTAVINREFPII